MRFCTKLPKKSGKRARQPPHTPLLINLLPYSKIIDPSLSPLRSPAKNLTSFSHKKTSGHRAYVLVKQQYSMQANVWPLLCFTVKVGRYWLRVDIHFLWLRCTTKCLRDVHILVVWPS